MTAATRGGGGAVVGDDNVGDNDNNQ
jgi:hypothetical protein